MYWMETLVTRKALPGSSSAGVKTLLTYVLPSDRKKTYVESPILGQQKTKTRPVGFDVSFICGIVRGFFGSACLDEKKH